MYVRCERESTLGTEQERRAREARKQKREKTRFTTLRRSKKSTSQTINAHRATLEHDGEESDRKVHTRTNTINITHVHSRVTTVYTFAHLSHCLHTSGRAWTLEKLPRLCQGKLKVRKWIEGCLHVIAAWLHACIAQFSYVLFRVAAGTHIFLSVRVCRLDGVG
jgi:hypothetical protein